MPATLSLLLSQPFSTVRMAVLKINLTTICSQDAYLGVARGCGSEERRPALLSDDVGVCPTRE